MAKDRNDNKWKVSVDLGEKGQTSRHEISFDDGYSLFKTKTATREQIAAKYLNTEITGMLAANTAKVEKCVQESHWHVQNANSATITQPRIRRRILTEWKPRNTADSARSTQRTKRQNNCRDVS